MYIGTCVTSSTPGTGTARSCGQYSTTNCRCDVFAFDLRRSKRPLSKIDVSPFEDRCHGVSTFEDGCVDLRRSVIDVSTIEDR